MKEGRIARYTRMPRGRGKTDWKRVDALTDQDIEAAIRSDPDAAPLLDESWFRRARIVLPERKVPVSMRLNRYVLDWFKRQGKGYQSRINAVLEAYVRAQAEHGRKQAKISARQKSA